MSQAPLTVGARPGGPQAKRPIVAFEWHGWRRFVRDFVIMQIAFALQGFAIGLLVNSGVGRISPWGYLEYGLEKAVSIDVGLAYVLVTVAALLVAGILREPFGWGTLASFVFLTFFWIDVFEANLPILTGGAGFQAMMAVLCGVVLALGSALYIGLGAGAGPRESVMLAIARLFRVNVGVARLILEGALVGIGLLLGQSAGLNTILYVISGATALWLAFRLFNIKPRAVFWASGAS